MNLWFGFSRRLMNSYNICHSEQIWLQFWYIYISICFLQKMVVCVFPSGSSVDLCIFLFFLSFWANFNLIFVICFYMVESICSYSPKPVLQQKLLNPIYLLLCKQRSQLPTQPVLMELYETSNHSGFQVHPLSAKLRNTLHRLVGMCWWHLMNFTALDVNLPAFHLTQARLWEQNKNQLSKELWLWFCLQENKT